MEEKNHYVPDSATNDLARGALLWNNGWRHSSARRWNWNTYHPSLLTATLFCHMLRNRNTKIKMENTWKIWRIVMLPRVESRPTQAKGIEINREWCPGHLMQLQSSKCTMQCHKAFKFMNHGRQCEWNSYFPQTPQNIIMVMEKWLYSKNIYGFKSRCRCILVGGEMVNKNSHHQWYISNHRETLFHSHLSHT